MKHGTRSFTKDGVEFLEFNSGSVVSQALYDKFMEFKRKDNSKFPEAVEFTTLMLPWVDGRFYKSQSLPVVLASHHIGDVIHRLDIPMCNNAQTRKLNQLVSIDMIGVDNGVIWLTERGEIWKAAYLRYLEFFTTGLYVHDLRQNPQISKIAGNLVGSPSWNVVGKRSEGSKQKLMYQLYHMEVVSDRIQGSEALSWLFSDCCKYRADYLRNLLKAYP